MLGEAWREQMYYQGIVAAWAADVGPAGGRSPVGGAVLAEGWGKQCTFRCNLLTVGLGEDVSRPSSSFKLRQS